MANKVASLSITAACVAVFFATQPAAATVSIGCSGVDDDTISVDIGFGTLPVLNIISAGISAGGQRWAINPQPGETEMIVGDAAFLHDGLIARFTDPNVEGILAEVRILDASEGKDRVSVGTLRLPGTTAYGLTCEGP